MSPIVESPPPVVAIIMDGNGRWANTKGLPRVEGHRMGARSVRTITRACARLGVKSLVLYAFSLENFNRPQREIKFLMRLLRRFLVKERHEIMDNNIRFDAIGRLELLPSNVQSLINRIKEMSGANTGMQLTLALAYGGRAEIVDAARHLSAEVEAGRLSPKEIDEDLFAKFLYKPELSEVDLLIRTASEMRVSNFLLWQISYAELHVTPTCWPDFGEEQLLEAFKDYGSRVRKFGGLVTEGS